MTQIQDKISELNLKSSDLDIHVMHEVQLGMKVDNQVRPVRIKHKPTGKIIICKENKSKLKNILQGLDMIAEKIKNENEPILEKRIKKLIDHESAKRVMLAVQTEDIIIADYFYDDEDKYKSQIKFLSEVIGCLAEDKNKED